MCSVCTSLDSLFLSCVSGCSLEVKKVGYLSEFMSDRSVSWERVDITALQSALVICVWYFSITLGRLIVTCSGVTSLYSVAAVSLSVSPVTPPSPSARAESHYSELSLLMDLLRYVT